MKRLLLLTVSFLFAAGAFAAESGNLAEHVFNIDQLPLGVMSFGLPTLQAGEGETGSAAMGSSELNPGKAFILSAIIPGAGQYYAGKKLRAAAFFAVEVLAWTGVIYYYNKGMEKEDDFIAFADEHFSEDAYRDYEYNLALNPAHGDSGAFSGEFQDWTDRPWDVKIHYLPSGGFTHELPTLEERENNWSMKQQYYEMIGKYIHQFGFGWDDRIGDDPGTPFFDGSSTRSLFYMDMRHDSNQLLKTSAWGYNIALLNHVAAALEASFTVRAMKQEMHAQLSFRQVHYDRDLVPVGGFTFTW